MAPKMKAKRGNAGEPIPAGGDVGQAIRDLDHKLFDILEAYDTNQKAINEKIDGLKGLEQKISDNQKIAEGVEKAVGLLTESNKETKTAIDELKAESVASKKLLQDMGRKISVLEETFVLTEERNTAQDTVYITNRLATIDKHISDIVSSVKCIASQQVEAEENIKDEVEKAAKEINEKMTKNFNKIGTWMVNNINQID